jgi:ABC-type hemin transport system substrate-binding protein
MEYLSERPGFEGEFSTITGAAVAWGVERRIVGRDTTGSTY